MIVCSSEMDRHRKQLEVVVKPETKLGGDVQKVIIGDPEPPHIKEEQEELWIRGEGEQLEGLEEADIKIPFTPVSVKSEDDDEEKPMETEEEDCGGPEPARNSDTDKTEDSSEPETDDSDDWKETREHQLGVKSLNKEVHANDLRCRTGEKKKISCSECGKRFGRKGHLKTHMRTHTGEKTFICSECGKRFGHKGHLKTHMIIHTKDKPFSCLECGKKFTQGRYLKRHLITHTGEKHFSCLECSKKFTEGRSLKRHLITHTREKPFSCSASSSTSAPASSCMPRYYSTDASQSRKYCRRCQNAGIKRVKTPIYCRKCNVPLCLTAKKNCFEQWHDELPNA